MKRLVALAAFLLGSNALADSHHANLAPFQRICTGATNVNADVASVTDADLIREVERLAQLFKIPVGTASECAADDARSVFTYLSLDRTTGSKDGFAWTVRLDAVVMSLTDTRVGKISVPTVWDVSSFGYRTQADARAFWFEQVRSVFESFVTDWNKSHK